MARHIARVSLVFGALVVVADIIHAVLGRHPSHGAVVVPLLFLGVLLTGLAAVYLALIRGPSHGTLGDMERVVVFLLMCVLLVIVVWMTCLMVEEVLRTYRYHR